MLGGNANLAAVGQLLVTLGEQVRSVSESDAGAPVTGKLSQLGDLLFDRGNALTGQ